ncbi:hypothetical protein ACI2UL_18385 [Ralstonia nicotianae]
MTIAPSRVHFTSGPSETFATRDDALVAGRTWRNAQQPGRSRVLSDDDAHRVDGRPWQCLSIGFPVNEPFTIISPDDNLYYASKFSAFPTGNTPPDINI